MRVGHVLYALTAGGMERGVLNIVDGVSPGFRHLIICLTAVDVTSPEVAPRCEIVELNKANGNDWRIPGRIAAVAKRARLDILHARGWPTLLETAIGARLAGVRGTVYSFHGRTIQELGGIPRRRRWAQRVVVPRYRRIVTLNPRMRQEFAAECRLPEARIELIANGVETTRFRPLDGKQQLRARFGVPGDRFIVGNVARLDAVKNHILILRAAKRCAEQGLLPFVLLVGEGPHRAAIEAEIARLGMNSHVRLYGHSADVPELLNCLDVYVQASLYEGFSNTLLEAMACGVPVVASDVGGTADIVRDGVEGRLFSCGDEIALAARLMSMGSEPGGRVMGAAGRDLVCKKYSLRLMVARYEALYAGLADEATGPQRQQGRKLGTSTNMRAPWRSTSDV